MSDGKNKYITAYGSSNEDSYGRGDVTDISTKYNMLTTNPLYDENAPKMNSYSSDGSYNQDIFGWKCFNSPVSFRNGIYGECGAIVASDEFYTYSIDEIKNSNGIGEKSGLTIFNYGSARISCGNANLEDSDGKFDSDAVYIRSSKGDTEAAIHVASTKVGGPTDDIYYSTIIVKSNYTSLQVDSDNYCTIYHFNNDNIISFTGDRGWVIGQLGKPLKSAYVETVNVDTLHSATVGNNYISIASDVIPETNADVSLGSNSNRFNKLFAKEIHSTIVHRSEQDFLPFDTRVVHVQLSIGIRGTTEYTQHQVTISPGSEFIFSSSGYADEFGDADLGEGSPIITSIKLDSAKFMDASIASTGNVTYIDKQSNISINDYRFVCISSYTSQSADHYDIAGQGRFFTHQFYIVVTRIE